MKDESLHVNQADGDAVKRDQFPDLPREALIDIAYLKGGTDYHAYLGEESVFGGQQFGFVGSPLERVVKGAVLGYVVGIDADLGRIGFEDYLLAEHPGVHPHLAGLGHQAFASHPGDYLVESGQERVFEAHQVEAREILPGGVVEIGHRAVELDYGAGTVVGERGKAGQNAADSPASALEGFEFGYALVGESQASFERWRLGVANCHVSTSDNRTVRPDNAEQKFMSESPC